MKTALNSSSNTFSLKTVFLDFKEITNRVGSKCFIFLYSRVLLGFSKVSFSVVCVDNASDRGILYGRASNAFNQVIEKDLDALMDRTKTVQFLREECLLFSIGCASVLTIVGITLLYMINPKTAMFGAISIFLYTSVYTPLKTVIIIRFVGAFPGAIPFMLGWVAATGDFGIEAGTLFLIQFFGNSPFLGNWLVLMKIMKGFFYVANRQKTRHFAGYFVYGMAYYSVITALLRLHW
jgi:protoheme IX farnesyltransferase